MNRKIGVIISYVLMIFEVMSTLLLTPLIIRTLGQSEYGVYKLASAVNAYLLLLDLGVGNAITRYIAKFRIENDQESERKFLGVAIIYYSIIAILVIIIGFFLNSIFSTVFAKGLSSHEIYLGKKLLIITMINSAITLGTAAFINVIIAYEHFVVSKGSSIIQIIIRITLTYVALKIGMGSVGVVVVNLVTTIFCRMFFVLYVFLKLKLIPLFSKIEIGFVKEIVIYSTWILLQMLATQLNNTVDQIIIGTFVVSSSTIIAIYGVGTQIVQYFQSMGSAFNGVLMPGIVRLVATKPSTKVITDEMIRIGRVILIVLSMIWCGFIIEGKNFIILWAGKDNYQAYYVALILMTMQLFLLTEAVGSQILWAMNEHKEQAILKFIIVLLNIFLTIILVKWNPLIGATIGTAISLLLGDVLVMNIIFKKKIHISLIYYYKGLFKGILPSIIMTFISGLILKNFFSNNWFGLGLRLSILSAIYVLLLYICGMNNYEKSIITSIINKVLKKRK